jgi:esterase/lipase superfamily enzyme
VIGIGDYADGWGSLKQAPTDARKVADELVRHGFKVTLKTDADQKLDKPAIEKLIDDFVYGPGVDPNARLFIWFAGHGYTIDGEGYFVPQGAPNPKTGPLEQRPLAEAEFRRHALSLRRFGEYMRETKARHVLSIFDSCFSGTIFETTRSLKGSDISTSAVEKVRYFISSGDADQEVSDDGLFRELFVGALNGTEPDADENKDGFISATELGRFLATKVTLYKKSSQVPMYGRLREPGLDKGEFLFRVMSSKPQTATVSKSTESSIDTAPLLDIAPAALNLPFATRGSALPLYFVTDRSRSADPTRVGFTNERTSILTLGKALVRVPEEPRSSPPSTSSGRFFNPSSPSINFALDGMSVLEHDEFASSFARELPRIEKFKGQVFIYLHGYNVDFDSAFYQTAKIAHDMGFDGPAIAYSWPSAAKASSYLSDLEGAQIAAPLFGRFVEWLITRTSIEQVNIISHNMGGAILAETMRYLARTAPSVKSKIGHLVFIAPDVNSELFVQAMADSQGLGRSVTLYVSANDKALQASTMIHNGPRAGAILKDGPLVVAGVDTIDISAVSTDLFRLTVGADDSAILNDISSIFQNKGHPENRLPVFSQAGAKLGPYWRWIK